MSPAPAWHDGTGHRLAPRPGEYLAEGQNPAQADAEQGQGASGLGDRNRVRAHRCEQRRGGQSDEKCGSQQRDQFSHAGSSHKTGRKFCRTTGSARGACPDHDPPEVESRAGELTVAAEPRQRKYARVASVVFPTPRVKPAKRRDRRPPINRLQGGRCLELGHDPRPFKIRRRLQPTASRSKGTATASARRTRQLCRWR